MHPSAGAEHDGDAVAPDDIDDLKRARDALAASEARLALVLKGSDDGWWDWDLDSGALYYSARWWSMLGMAPDALPADQALWERLLHPDDKAHVEAVFGTALSAGPDNYAVEFRLRHADGHWVPVLSRGHIARDADGKPRRVSGSNTDLTERHKAEADLRRSEQQQRFILDHMVAGLLVLGPDGSLLHHNPRAADLLGVPLPFGQPGWLQQLQVLRDDGTVRPPDECLFERAIRSGGELVQGVFGLLRPGTAQPVWLLASAMAERSADGAAQQVLISFVDITERRRAEQQQRQSEASLRNLLEAMADGVFVAQDGRFLFVNPAMPAMLGHTVASMQGLPFDKVIDPVSMPQWTVRYLQRIGSGPEPIRHYEVYLMPRGGGHSILIELRAHRTTFGGRPAVMGIVRNIDEQRRTELELRAVQAFAKATLDGLTAQICVLDASGDVVSSNSAWADAMGAQIGGSEPQTGINYLRALPALFQMRPAQVAAFTDGLQQVLGGQTPNFEVQLLRKQEQGAQWFTVRLTRGGAEGPRRVIVAHEDVTAQIRAQQHIETLHDRLALALDGAGYGVWEYDLGAQRFEWDAQMLALHGHSVESFTGSDAEAVALVHPDDRERVRKGFAAMAAGGSAVVIDCRIRRHDDGRERCIEIIGRRRTTHDGTAPRLVGINRDITAAKDAEAALRASEQRWKFALEGAGDGVWDHDLVSGEMVFSRQWKEMLGHDETELGSGIGVWRERVHADDLPALDAAMAQSLQDGASFVADHRLRRKDGSWMWVQARGMVVARDAAGRPLRMVGTHADQTEQRRAESARAELQAQLREAQKMDAIGTLAGGVAHDFNNVLAGILGNVALAQQDVPADHPAAASIEQIRQAGLRARALVQQILAFSRRQPQQMSAQALAPRIDEALALLRVTVPSVVQIESALSTEPLHVMADPTQLQQVLMNLCTNAWHALQGSTGRIVVGLDAVELGGDAAPVLPHGLQPGRHAHVWVSDNGCGMDAQTLARVFDPFFTTKPVGQGTGLGLSVAHSIVHAHGGAMTVDSAPGVGTTFHLYFPLVAPRMVGVVQPTLAAVPGNGEKVLYIDDDAVMAITVERLLQRAGYKVQVFTDAREALAELHSAPEHFDLVVTDFNMPNLSGLDVARAVLALRPSLPIVISSGYISDVLRRDAKTLGVRALMKKERTVEELHGLVHRVLGKTL